MGTDHLADGAVLMCINGSEKKMLKIGGHGYITGEREKANCKDCKACVNIPYFGECTKNTETHRCEGFMKLEERWKSTVVSSQKPEKVDGEEVITMDSILVCKRGGVIIPVTSGQGYEEGFDCFAFAQRFQRAILWAMGKGYIDPATGEGCSENGGDPVNLNTGNFVYEKEDLVIPGITKLSFHIYYNSMEKRSGGSMGEGWHHNYGMHIQKEGKENLLYLCTDEGRKIPYRRNIGDIYDAVFGDSGLLKKEGIGFRYGAEDGAEYIFDAEGKMLSRKDRNGNMDTYSYNEKGQLVKVAGANGGVLYYTYNKEGSLIRVEDHTGRKVQLWYQYRKLWKFINCMGHAYTFDYNADGKLESVVTPRGIRGVYNEYDAIGRVIRQEMPDGGVISLAYDDKNMRTYMRERNGSMIIYEKDERCRNIRTVYEDSEEIFGYNDNNKRTLYVDRNGNQTRYGYDSKGNVTRITDALGRQVRFSYDEDGNITQFCFPEGSCISSTLDKRKQLMERTYPYGNIVCVQYNNQYQPERVQQPDGSEIKLKYDMRGNLIQIIDALGNSTAYEYDILNRIVAIIDGKRNCTKLEYNNRNNIIKIVNASGEEKKYEYDLGGKLAAIIYCDGSVEEMSYNECNQLKCYKDREGNRTEYLYNRMGRLICKKLPNGGEVHYSYDKNNRLSEYKDAMGGKIKFFYDIHGNRKKIVDANGRAIYYTYDALNRLIGIKSPEGKETHYAYDTNGHLTSIVDPIGNRRSIEYDAIGRKIKEIDELGNITYIVYNSLGKPARIKDRAGRVTEYEYYLGGLLKSISFPDGRKIGYSYDKNRNIQEKWDNFGYRIHYDYDKQNRIVSVSSNKGQKIGYTYDLSGNVASVVDANGNVTKYEHSLMGKLISVEDAEGNLVKYDYDPMGNLTAVFRLDDKNDRSMDIQEAVQLGQKSNLRLTIYKRDLLGRIISIKDTLGNEEEYEYDFSGNLVAKTDREGYRTSITYNEDNKVDRIIYDDGRKAKYFYGCMGQLERVEDWTGVTNIEYDRYGRIQKITDCRGRSIMYEWGNLNERKSLVYPDGSKINYIYDSLLRLQEMTYGQERVKYYYGIGGRLEKKICNNGLTTDYGYEETGKLVKLTHKYDDRVLEDYQYTYNALGNKVKMRKYRKGLPNECGEYQYHYDSLGRLTDVEKDGKILREYTYDAFGNRVSMLQGEEKTEYVYNILDQLVGEERDGKYVYNYDRRGNMTEVIKDGVLEKRFFYNSAGRLETVENSSGMSSVYSYNGMNRRISKEETYDKEKGVYTEYFWDMSKEYHNLLALKQGEKIQTYRWGNMLEGMEEERRNSFALLDEMGSPVRFLWKNGNEMSCYSYDEFGCNLYEKGDDKQPFGYTGYLTDEISGTYFAQAREYMPEIGRFGGKDIKGGNSGNTVSLNRYVYCLANPLVYIDNNGKEPTVSANCLPFSNPFTIDEQLLPQCGWINGELKNKLEKDNLLNSVEWYDFCETHDYVDTLPEPKPIEVPKLPEKEDKIFNVTTELGTGLYTTFDLLGYGFNGGVKSYFSFSDQGDAFTEFGIEGGMGYSIGYLGTEAGYRYLVNGATDIVLENGLYTDYSLLFLEKANIEQEDMDIHLKSSLGIYVGLGGQVNLDINLGAAGRKFIGWKNDVIEWWEGLFGDNQECKCKRKIEI